MQHRGAARCLILGAALWVLAGCGGVQSPGLEVSGLRVLAPVPGTSVGVAYGAISNTSGAERQLVGVASPHFERIEMHTTAQSGDRVTMRPLASVSLAPGADTLFEEGGKHLMLWNPSRDVTAGDVVELRFSFDDGLVVTVSTTLRSRLD